MMLQRILGRRIILILLAVSLPVILFAQEADKKKDDKKKDVEGSKITEAVPETKSDTKKEGEGSDDAIQEFITSATDVWNPPNRREPFSSPIQKIRTGAGGDERVIVKKGKRPPGIEGMELKELELVGVLFVKGIYKAMFIGSDDFAYTLQPGEEIWDSKVKEIDMNCVTFEQETEDVRFLVRRIKTVRKCLETE